MVHACAHLAQAPDLLEKVVRLCGAGLLVTLVQKLLQGCLCMTAELQLLVCLEQQVAVPVRALPEGAAAGPVVSLWAPSLFMCSSAEGLVQGV